ncbi:MAG: MopE-related protein [Polyangiaceae bacterium]
MRYLGYLIRLGVISVAGFASMTACSSDGESNSPPGGSGGNAGASTGGASAGTGGGGAGTSGTGGISGSGGGTSDAGPDAPTGCTNGETQACYTGPPATQGIGNCSDGTTTCQNGTWSACVGDILPSTETCDTVDNNCNGAVDEGCACTNGESRTCYSGPQSTTNTGLCKDGTQACVNGAWANECVGEVTPVSESCNNKDDDCDGLIDNGNPDGGGGCTTAQPGECAAGTEMCQGGQLTCVANNSPKTETCNGKDDNCNGSTDEGNPGGGGACTTGNFGICNPGTLTCQGASLMCVQNVQPTTETCNGKDDNCNGTVDENNPGGGGACTVPGKKGECAKSNLTCTNGSLQCLQKVFPTTEICDGKDNNCNGLIDEYPACCPYVLSDDGAGFRYESTVGGVALVGKAQHMDPSGTGKRIDFMPMWVRLEHARVECGRARVKILAAEDEIVYLDEAHLTVVEHPPGCEVFTSTSISRRPDEAPAGEDFTALPSASLRPPQQALYMGEHDVTREISQLTEHAVRHDLAADNYYELDFGPAALPRQARLVVDGWRLRLERHLPQELIGRKPCLEVEQADGSFRKVMDLGAPRGDKKALCFDLSEVQWPSGRYRMRLYLGTAQAGKGMWFVDRVRLSEAAPVPLRRHDVIASHAELAFNGAPTLAAGGDPTRTRQAIDDGRGAPESEQRTFGRFTRYGDVTTLLRESNDMFAIMRRGDAVVFEFQGIPSATPGSAQTLFLHSDLVFKPRALPGSEATEKTEWVGPLPFHGMGRYGRDTAHGYPTSAAHRHYQRELLTREYLPSEMHFGATARVFILPRRTPRRRAA